jgi:hypothetical protein
MKKKLLWALLAIAVIVILILAAVAGILSGFIFYQRRD